MTQAELEEVYDALTFIHPDMTVLPTLDRFTYMAGRNFGGRSFWMKVDENGQPLGEADESDVPERARALVAGRLRRYAAKRA